jgi:hypothetical protein
MSRTVFALTLVGLLSCSVMAAPTLQPGTSNAENPLEARAFSFGGLDECKDLFNNGNGRLIGSSATVIAIGSTGVLVPYSGLAQPTSIPMCQEELAMMNDIASENGLNFGASGFTFPLRFIAS